MLTSVNSNSIVFPTGSDTVQKTEVTVEKVRNVFAGLEHADAQRFVHDLKFYARTGERSAFLRGIVALAAGDIEASAH